MSERSRTSTAIVYLTKQNNDNVQDGRQLIDIVECHLAVPVPVCQGEQLGMQDTNLPCSLSGLSHDPFLYIINIYIFHSTKAVIGT